MRDTEKRKKENEDVTKFFRQPRTQRMAWGWLICLSVLLTTRKRRVIYDRIGW